eukprot:scaffold332366_cov18-Prasinocladus_malaysianus.AAC.1
MLRARLEIFFVLFLQKPTINDITALELQALAPELAELDPQVKSRASSASDLQNKFARLSGLMLSAANFITSLDQILCRIPPCCAMLKV